MIKKRKTFLVKGLSLIFWIILWQIIAGKINQELLLASPLAVLKQTVVSAFERNFWERVFFSYFHIMAGFFIAIFTGIVLAVLSYNFKAVKILLHPLIASIRSVPTAAVIILFLIWTDVKNLSVLVSVFMTLPIIYVSILKGLEEVDKNLLEMAKVFRITALKKIIYIYISQILPYFESGGLNALGIAWKSGIAAEVIGIPTGSIGEVLYESKVYLNTVNLFSWAIVIIILGFISEKVFVYLIKLCIRKIEGR